MKYILIPAVAATMCLTACSNQQKAEANSKAQEFKAQAAHATENARKELTDGGITLKIKTAMGTSDKLDTSGINVDTIQKVAHLRGTVATADQKVLAERIAKDTVGKDVQVVDELKVQPKAQTQAQSQAQPTQAGHTAGKR